MSRADSVVIFCVYLLVCRCFCVPHCLLSPFSPHYLIVCSNFLHILSNCKGNLLSVQYDASLLLDVPSRQLSKVTKPSRSIGFKATSETLTLDSSKNRVPFETVYSDEQKDGSLNALFQIYRRLILCEEGSLGLVQHMYQ